MWSGAAVKNLPANSGKTWDVGLIPGLGRSPGVGRSNPLWYSCLKNSMDRGAWNTRVHRVAKNWTWLIIHTWCKQSLKTPFDILLRLHTCAKSLLSCLTLCNPMDCSPPVSSIHGIVQARILEWVAMPYARRSSDSGIKPASLMFSELGGGFFTTSATLEAQLHWILPNI